MTVSRNNFRILAVFGAILWLAGCASQPPVSTSVTYCCRPLTDQVYTFRIEFDDTPEFLKPMLRDEAATVLNAKGLRYTEGDADAVLKMSFVNKTLERDQERIESWEKTAPAGGVRFIAQVVLEMTHSVTGELIWSGAMQRTHNVYEGSYMHDAPARAAMRTAFLEVFADYPDRRLETE
jgi:hypothetical protein